MKEFIIKTTMDNLPARLDKLVANLSSMSRSKIQIAIKSGQVLVDNQVISDPSTIITKICEIGLNYTEENQTDLIPKEMDLNIIYEDDDIIIIDKQAGLTVHPGAGNYQDTLVNGLLYRYKNLSDINSCERPGIVHRIDRDTTGLLAIARNNQAHVNLAKQIEKKTAQRTYLCIVWGMPKITESMISTQIGRSNSDKSKMCVLAHGGKNAITYYKILEVLCEGLFSLVECRLETGRTHQIRVHMSHIGHSIVGDPIYGTNARKVKQLLNEDFKIALGSFNRQALHAYRLALCHPLSGEEMVFTADLPNDMRELLSIMRNGTRGQT